MTPEFNQNPSALAHHFGLSRKTCSVTRDGKKDQIIIVEEVSIPEGKDGKPARIETYYRVYPEVSTSDINDLIADAKRHATYEFLGNPGFKASEQPVQEMDRAPATEEPVRKKSKAKKATAKKAPAKKAVAKKAKPAPEPVEEEDNLFNEVDDVPKGIVYDKASREHTSILKPLLHETLGADWKQDKEKYSLVRSLIGELHGKIEVTDVKGAELGAFSEFVKKYIDENQAIDMDEE